MLKFLVEPTGLELNHASATLKNTIFHTFQDFGILGINATVNAENLVVNNCGQANLGIFKGGNYTFYMLLLPIIGT